MSADIDITYTTYSKDDSVETLKQDQLALMAKTQYDILILYLEQKTHFDAHRVRLLLELGTIEAARRLAEFNPSSQTLLEEKS